LGGEKAKPPPRKLGSGFFNNQRWNRNLLRDVFAVYANEFHGVVTVEAFTSYRPESYSAFFASRAFGNGLGVVAAVNAGAEYVYIAVVATSFGEDLGLAVYASIVRVGDVGLAFVRIFNVEGAGYGVRAGESHDSEDSEFHICTPSKGSVVVGVVCLWGEAEYGCKKYFLQHFF
jgi:hypothetical protein